MSMHVGELVEVRSKAEILNTLDKDGKLEGMPFTPQMLQFCGKRFRVHKSGHKTCDPIYTMASRRVPDGVHLNLRCDGKAYGNCQVGCLLFWKVAWLKNVETADQPERTDQSFDFSSQSRSGCTEEDLIRSTRVQDGSVGNEVRYVCQTTELPKFSTALPWWKPKQYVEDNKSGNTTIKAMLKGAFYATFVRYPTRLYLPRAIYNWMQSLIGGEPSPVNWGTQKVGAAQPNAELNLQAGDLVRIKTHQEILSTLDRRNKNRGLYFDVEMVPYCGGLYRVRSRIDTYIEERTGKMRSLKTPAIILDNVFCKSLFSKRRMYCPRGLHSWWREAWLERVHDNAVAETGEELCAVAALRAQARLAEAPYSAASATRQPEAMT